MLSMKNLKNLFMLASICLPLAGFSQTSNCPDFTKVKSMMESGFGTAKGTKLSEGTTNYGIMLITKTVWVSNYKFPEALSADITEVLKVAPDPKNAGHNVYISFNFVKNSTRAVAEAAFNKIRESIRSCTPAGWKMQEKSGTTYSRYILMDGNYYDESPHKMTLQFNKLDGPGDKYTTDLIFDGAIK